MLVGDEVQLAHELRLEVPTRLPSGASSRAHQLRLVERAAVAIAAYSIASCSGVTLTSPWPMTLFSAMPFCSRRA